MSTEPTKPTGQIQLIPFLALCFSVLTSLLVLSNSMGSKDAATNATIDGLQRRLTVLETQGASYASCQVENAQLRTEVTGLRRDVEDLKRLIQARFVGPKFNASVVP